MGSFNRDALRSSLKQAKDSEKAGGGLVDQRFWKPEVPEKGRATYRIRILPNVKTNGVPWIKYFQHVIKSPDGKWVVENCPVTLGKDCPFCNYSAGLFNTGDPSDEKTARTFWRKKNYMANILVVKDPRNEGANEGKIFLYRFGQKIWQKLDAALFPDEKSGEEELFFIDPVEGYDLNLVCKTQGQGKEAYPNYDDSTFAREKTAIAPSTAEMDKILDEIYDMESEFLSPSKFKSFDVLEDMFQTKFKGVSTKEDKPAKVETKQESKVEEKSTTKTEVKQVAKEEVKQAVKEEKSSKSDDDFLKDLENELDL